jgi:predicted outer membrane protein
MHRSPARIISALGMMLVVPFAANAQVKSSGGNVALYSQKHLVNHIIVGDSVVLEMAQLAAKQTKNTAVKEFANALIADRTKYLESLRKVAENKDVGREASPGDTSSAQSIKALAELQKAAADSAFDQIFLQALIAHYEREVAALKQLRAAATDSLLQTDLDNAVTSQEEALVEAKALSAKLSPANDSTKKSDSTYKRSPKRKG